ncbi:MAG: S8 family serine peptidase [Clostridia bacterium]|nr:S8 family serine peptidase [Clostridia bacterium]
MRFLSCLLALTLILSVFALPAASSSPAETVEVFVTLAEEGVAYTVSADRLCFPEGQAAIADAEALLERTAEEIASLRGAEVFGSGWYLSLSLGVRLPADLLDELAAIDGISSVEVLTDSLIAADSAEAAEESAAVSAASAVYAPDLIGARALHSEGILGEGAIIAVIDTGYDTAHPVFTLPEGTAPSLTQEILTEYLPLLSVSKQTNGERYDVDDLWYSDKIPFAFDYNANDADVSAANTHGTHVASIAAGGADADGTYVGIAPGAQLLLMKIFDDSGSGSSSEYALYRAVEDAMILGADVINLSLGSSPGFPYATNTFSISRHLDRARELGCVIVCAVGNDGAVGNGSRYDVEYGVDFPLAANPDYGLTADPASFSGTLAVGAYVPDRVLTSALLAGDGSTVDYVDSASGQGFAERGFVSSLDGQTLPYVVVPGVGSTEDYAGLDLTGKLALVERGEITFTEKLLAAAAAGAVGMICRDNVEGSIINMAFDEMPIPAVSISRAAGERLAALPEEQRTISISSQPVQLSTPADAGQPAEYSTVGSGLQIRPALLSPGTIYAALSGGTYGTKQGTSMATPVISGIAALAVSAAGDAGTAAFADALMAEMITTAEPMLDADGHPYSVRVQGGGMVRTDLLFSAESTLRAEDGRGVVELGDELSADGEFSFTLTLTNHSDTARTYAVSGSVGSDDIYILEQDGEQIVFAADTMRVFSDAMLTVNGTEANRFAQVPASASVTLDAGESRTLTVRGKLSAAEAAEYKTLFENGYYLEGYVWVESEGECLSLPYLGFVGDFDALPYFDTFAYDGKDSFFTGSYLYGTAANALLYLGCNVYDEAGDADSFRSDLIAFSPNGDGFFDEVQVSLRLLRNLYSFEIEIRDADGNIVTGSARTFYLTKSFVDDDGEMKSGFGTAWSGNDADSAVYVMPEGEYTVILRALGRGAVSAEEVALPVVLDVTAPELVEYHMFERNGVPMLSVTLRDNHYPMRAKLYRTAVDEYGRETELYCDDHQISYREGRRAITLLYDLSGFTGDYLYLDVYDYALNSHTYRIEIEPIDDAA